MIKVSLSSIIDVISGGTPKTKVPEYWNGSIGWLSVTDFNNDLRFVYDTEKKITEKGVKESNTKFLNKGDIIISARGTVGALAQIGKPMCFNQSCFGIRGKHNIADTDFLYYSLKNYVRNIIKRSQGSVFDTINLKSFDLMEIEIPKSITTQKKIAKVLSDLDAKIEINNKITQELEAMAKTLYDYWFVQFDFPNANGKPYKSSGGKMVFNEELKREIPEGWEVKNLIDLCTKIGDGLHGTPKYVEDSEYCFINGNNLKNGFISIDSDTKKVSFQEFDSQNIVLDSDSILLSINGTLGNLAIYNNEKVMLGKSSAFLNCKENNRTYCYEYLNQEHMKKVFWNIATGSTIKNLGLESLKKLKILDPNNNLIENFDKLTKYIVNKRRIIFKENQKLSELRDWLLPMLMNGQVSVGNAYTNDAEDLGMVAESEVKYGKETL